jgi:hypothetical protein
MTKETRVGYMATSILEEMCLEYIRAHTKEGKFIGDVKYLDVYINLKRYNSPMGEF